LSGFRAFVAAALAEIVFAGLGFVGEGEGFLGFLDVEVFLVPMTVQYTTRPDRRTRPSQQAHRGHPAAHARGFAASALRLEHPKSLRMRD
jgi:hypothetical protein